MSPGDLSAKGSGLRWSEFAAAAPELAGDVTAVIERYRFALIGTIRKDGTPRISSVETHLVGPDLVVVMIPKSRKAADVRRDNRVTLQSPITDASNPGAEYKVRGRARAMTSNEECKGVADAVEASSGWRPRDKWLFLAILLSDASHTAWSTNGTAMMKRWNLNASEIVTRHLRLDMESGAYR